MADLELISVAVIDLDDASLVGVGQAGELAVLSASPVEHQEVVSAELVSLLLQLELLDLVGLLKQELLLFLLPEKAGWRLSHLGRRPRFDYLGAR